VFGSSRLIALVGDSVEHLAHRPVDDDLAFYVCRSECPF
jgi:hypothetical protein